MRLGARITAVGAGLFMTLLLLPRLLDSLWIDELGTYWAIQGGPADVVERSMYAHQQSASYYLVLWLLTRIFGSGEISLRALSCVCFALSLILIYKLGRLLFNRRVAAYAIFLATGSSLMLQAAVDARPYALAITLTLAATLSLIEWCASLRPAKLLQYLCFAVGMYYAHYLYVLFLAVHALYVANAYRMYAKPERSKLMIQSVFAAVAGAAALAPSLPHLSFIGEKNSKISYTALPEAGELLKSLAPLELLTLCALIIILRLVFRRRRVMNVTDTGAMGGSLIFVLTWAFLPPLLLFLICHLFGYSLFISRYYAARDAAIALLGAYLLDRYLEPAKGLAALLVFLVIVFAAERHRRADESSYEGWKQAASAIRQEDPSGACPVLLLSGFIETQTVSWLNDRRMGSFLRVPLEYYLVSNRSVNLPYTFDLNDTAPYLREVVEPFYASADCVWLLYRSIRLSIQGQDFKPSPTYLMEVLPAQGFGNVSRRGFGLIELIRFNKLDRGSLR